jgi:transposase
MDKLDMRKLGYKELYFVKKQVVRLKQNGLTGAEIFENTGVDANQVSKIWTVYKKRGIEGLKPKKRGRSIGEGKLLDKEQEREIRQTIIDKTPDQLKFSFNLWTRLAISALIKRKYKKVVSLRSITNYLKSWGFTCQRPSKRAYSQDNIRVNRFMKEEYPAIAKRAKAENAEIYWGDETGINNQENYQRGFSPKGVTPIIKFETKHEKINMLSAIANNGKVRFMMFDENMTQQRLIDFMKRMIKDVEQKVYLILDNLRVHHGKLVQKWLDENSERIAVFYLPPYAPEYNPDEYLNHALKRDVHTGINPRTKNDISHKVQSFMRRLQHNSDCVKAFFKHPKMAYVNSDF